MREIFRIFLEQGSFIATIAELNHRGWRTKGGTEWDKYSLRRLLRCPLYVGKVGLHGEVYAGQHEAIVEESVWDSVQH